MAAGEWDTLLGIRRDIDLTERWWHRLFKVLYFVSFATVVGFGSWLLWEGFDSVTPDRKLVRIVSDLSSYLSAADVKIANVVPGFKNLDGRLGIVSDDGKKIDYISDYAMDQTWCTPSALAHLNETADFLNERDFTKANTGMTVLAGVQRVIKPEDKESRLCWVAASLREKSLDQVVKYEFTRTGYFQALWEHYFWFILGVAITHTVFLNLYYRGLVYIIVGKRKQPKPVVQDDDEDDDDKLKD